MGGAYRGRGEPPTLSLPSPTPPVRPLSFRQAFILTESLPPHPLKPLSLQRRISWRTGFSALEHFKTELFHFPCIPLLFFLSAEPNSRRAASPPVESLGEGGARGGKTFFRKLSLPFPNLKFSPHSQSFSLKSVMRLALEKVRGSAPGSTISTLMRAMMRLCISSPMARAIPASLPEPTPD